MNQPAYNQDVDLGADLGGVDARDNYSPFPAGEYLMQAVDVELKYSSAGNNMVAARFEVVEGECAGRKIFENYNIQHPNHQTVEIALKSIKQWVIACGGTGDERLTLGLLKGLEGREFVAKVIVEKDKSGQYGDKNRIRAFKPAAGAAPQPAARAQQQAAPAAAAVPRAGKKPWEK